MSADRCRRVAGQGTRTKVRGAGRLRTKYNLGPQSYVPVVRAVSAAAGDAPEATNDDRFAREVCAMRWGLVPAFAKRPEDFDVFKGGSSTFNARVEGVESSQMWRRLVESRRGVVLFDGFYEWKTDGRGKVPMFIRHRDDYAGHCIASASNGPTPTATVDTEVDAPPALSSLPTPVLPTAEPTTEGPRHAPLLLAGLYDFWRPHGGPTEEEPLESVAILTMDSMGTQVEQVHDRMPVILNPETAALWLDPERRFRDVLGPVLKEATAQAQRLYLYEVAPVVSNVKNESPDCVMARKDYDARQVSKGIGRFFKRKAEPEAETCDAAAPPAKRPTVESRKDEVKVEAAPAEGVSLGPMATDAVEGPIELD